MLALMSRDVAEIAPEVAAVDALHDTDAAVASRSAKVTSRHLGGS